MAQTGMNAFCGSEFWINSGDSYFSPCFERTVLAWVPCAFLWLFLVFEVHYLVRSKDKNVPRTWLNVAKLVGTIALFLVAVADLSHAVYLSSNDYDTFAVDYTTPVVQALTFLMGAALVEANRRRGLRSSGLQFQFWLLAALCGALRFRSLVNAALYQSSFSATLPFFSYMLHYALTVLMLLLNCWADAAPRYSDIPMPKNVCPERQSSFLSRLTFSWFDSMAWRGYRRPLEASDLWTQYPLEASEHLVPRFEKYWSESVQKTARAKHLKASGDKTVHKKPQTSIVPAICKAFGPTFLLGSLLKFISDVTGFFNPVILQLLIGFVWSDAADWKGFLYAGLLFANVSFTTVILSQYFHRMFTVGLRIRSALIAAIFRKALRLSSTARQQTTMGEIVNLMSVDAQRFMDLIAYFNMIWSNPLQFSLCFYLLWTKLGVSVLAGLLVLLLLIPVDVVIAARVRTLQVQQMARKDDRVRLITEILNGIKVLKLYAWEKIFEKQVLEIRNSEVTLLKKSAYYDAGNSFIWSFAPILVSLVTFATFVLSSEDNVLDAETAFVSLTLFNMMRYSLTMLPVMITSLVQASVSVKRINKFLNMDEVDPNCVSHDDKEVEPLVVENGTFAWSRDEAPVLKNVSLRCRQGALVAVVGTVGSGKSSLLAALLGDMEKLSGRVNTKGSIAYVPQQAWIQNASLKDNVLFSKPSDQATYARVIEACALNPDIEALPGGDDTEIGEKGINLSGGQKARVSLARAVYQDADVYFLDDPLSAVDSHVARHIFQKVIGPRGLLRDKTRVLVTHGVTFLPEADLIVVLKDGEVTEVGTYEQLMAWHGAFADLMKQHPQEWRQDETDTELTDTAEETPDEKFEAPSKKPDKKLIETEKSQVGSVKWSVYLYYSLSVGVLLTASTLLFNVAYQGLGVASNMWLSVWSSAQTNASLVPVERDHFLGVYAALGAGQALFVLLPSVALVVATVRAAVRLHGQLLNHTLHQPMSFFDTTPAGRVVNRFAKDVDVVDNTLPANIRTWLTSFFSVVATLVVISFTNKYFMVLIVPIGVLYYVIQRFYIPTSRQLKRLESTSRSPIYSHFGESINGTSSIRAYHCQDRFARESELKVDTNQMPFYLSIISNRWLAIRLEMLGNLIILLAAVLAVLARDTMSPGMVGLSISYALQITATLNFLVRMTSDVETNIVAVERIKEYSETLQEAPWEQILTKPARNWPRDGNIEFRDYQVRYREGTELVLHGVSCSIRAGEKVGLVGRTGAGKSSLALGIFRIMEASGGSILIDGLDISTLGLHDLRARLTIIPQDPVLFSGPLRTNLDPLGAHSDPELWRALQLAHLRDTVEGLPKGLSHELSEGGGNLSVGQRQLVCLARALLRKTRVIVLDEATGAVDLDTDDLIQDTIRSQFKDCTVLTIAHRLNTIMDSDRVLVLDQGRVVESGAPSDLLKDRSSTFHGLARQAGLLK